MTAIAIDCGVRTVLPTLRGAVPANYLYFAILIKRFCSNYTKLITAGFGNNSGLSAVGYIWK